MDIPVDAAAAVAEFTARLDGLGDAKTKAWWEGYMKGVIPFRGIKMPVLRAALLPWWRERVAPSGLGFEKAVAASFFGSTWSEDKLTGVLAFEHLARRLTAADLAAFEAIFRNRLLFDWNNTDWFCVKVLDKLVRRDIGFARPIAGWTALPDAPLWQRRAGAVAFVNVAKHGSQPPGSPELWELMWTAARNNVHSPERFMQTSVGWLVRELGRADQDAALAFLAEHRALLSRKAARDIVERLPAEMQAAALAR